jgi:hypothetical protein
MTPLGRRLQVLLKEYLDKIEGAKRNGGLQAVRDIKPVNFVVITDGVPCPFFTSLLVSDMLQADAELPCT